MVAPPDGWEVWSDDEAVVWAYRPDVFDSQSFPAACLPTIYVARGRRNRRPGVNLSPPADAPWSVTLTMEPEVEQTETGFGSRAAAISAATELATSFATGELDYRELYRVTEDRHRYLTRLDELTGRAP